MKTLDFKVLLFLIAFIHSSRYSLSAPPQNIETFFLLPPPPQTTDDPITTPPPLLRSLSRPRQPDNVHSVQKAILLTAGSTILVSAMLFFFLRKCLFMRNRRRRRDRVGNSSLRHGGLNVDEIGDDVVYNRTFKQTETDCFTIDTKTEQIHAICQQQLPPPPPAPPAPPPPPPVPAMKRNPPPPPAKRVSTSKPPPAMPSRGQVKLKPLHWDKVNPADIDHPMVWDKLDHGSFSFDGNLMEVLFGIAVSTKKSPKTDEPRENSQAEIFILDPRKSQNTSIILKSIAVPVDQIIQNLIQGHEIHPDTLEKLTRIAPSLDDQQTLLEFDGDPNKLASAESFLFHLLQAVPSAFTRFNALLFRANYCSEINQIKECSRTLELACTELRTRGVFMKLLEAVLKSGNRMNEGTARGNAQAFNLTALRKLSDVKSGDGKTTLLHFVVEEVIRTEGKRIITEKGDEETDFLKLGLPIVAGLSSKFSNVKKSAATDYNVFVTTCAALAARASEVSEILDQHEEEIFTKNMRGFVELAEEELQVVVAEQKRVMEEVKKTTEYYQAGGAKNLGENPFQIFVIVKDFLGMVDHVCVQISKNLPKKNMTNRVSPTLKSPMRSPVTSTETLPESFPSRTNSSESEKSSNSSSSESDSDT